MKFLDMLRILNATKIINHLRLSTPNVTLAITSRLQNRNFCSAQSKDLADRIREPLDFSELKFVSKVPLEPHVSPVNLAKVDRIKIDEATIRLLEQLALVNVANE